jgi:hypothetical protein
MCRLLRHHTRGSHEIPWYLEEGHNVAVELCIVPTRAEALCHCQSQDAARNAPATLQ